MRRGGPHVLRVVGVRGHFSEQALHSPPSMNALARENENAQSALECGGSTPPLLRIFTKPNPQNRLSDPVP